MRDKSNKRILVYIATFLLVLIIAAFVLPLVYKDGVADEKIISVLNLFLGMIATHLLNILKDASGYEFGDSTGSQVKSEALKSANETIAAITVPAVEPKKGDLE